MCQKGPGAVCTYVENKDRGGWRNAVVTALGYIFFAFFTTQGSVSSFFRLFDTLSNKKDTSPGGFLMYMCRLYEHTKFFTLWFLSFALFFSVFSLQFNEYAYFVLILNFLVACVYTHGECKFMRYILYNYQRSA